MEILKAIVLYWIGDTSKDFHEKHRIFKRSSRANTIALDFKTSMSDHKEKKTFSSDCSGSKLKEKS